MRSKIYDNFTLRGCLDPCSCGNHLIGILPVRGDYEVGSHPSPDVVFVAECCDCGMQSDEGNALQVMLSWNLSRRAEAR